MNFRWENFQTCRQSHILTLLTMKENEMNNVDYDSLQIINIFIIYANIEERSFKLSF